MGCYTVLGGLIALIVGLVLHPWCGAGLAAVVLLFVIYELASQLGQGVRQATGMPPADDYDPSLW
jgi:hypothetical protein